MGARTVGSAMQESGSFIGLLRTDGIRLGLAVVCAAETLRTPVHIPWDLPLVDGVSRKISSSHFA